MSAASLPTVHLVLSLSASSTWVIHGTGSTTLQVCSCLLPSVLSETELTGSLGSPICFLVLIFFFKKKKSSHMEEEKHPWPVDGFGAIVIILVPLLLLLCCHGLQYWFYYLIIPSLSIYGFCYALLIFVGSCMVCLLRTGGDINILKKIKFRK